MPREKHSLKVADVERLKYDPNGPSRQVRWDGKVTGFGCRVTPGDGKQYVLSYRYNGRSRMMSLGPVEHFRTLTEARAKAEQLLHDLRHKGIDPMGARERLSESGTIAELWEAYTERHLSQQSAHTQRTCKSFWTAHLEHRIGHLKPQQITAADMVNLHDEITAGAKGSRVSGKARGPKGKTRGGPVVANRVIQRLSAFFTWLRARNKNLFPLGWENPTNEVTFHKEQPRDRYLDRKQLLALAESLDEESSPWVRTFILLLMLTGARSSEIRTARWEQVDLEAGTIHLPKAKSGKAEMIRLPAVAVQLLRELPVTPGTDCVFPGRPIEQPMAAPRQQLAAALKRAKLPHISFHDLRRSFGTSLVDDGAGEKAIATALRNTTTVASHHYIQIRQDTLKELRESHAAAILPKQVSHEQ